MSAELKMKNYLGSRQKSSQKLQVIKTVHNGLQAYRQKCSLKMWIKMLQWFLKGRSHKINVTTFFDLVPDFLNEGDISDLIYLDFITEFNIVTRNK